MDKKKDGAPGPIRTADRLVRSQVLYPTELRARVEMLTFLLAKIRSSFLSAEALAKADGGERGIRTLDGAFGPILP